MAQWSHFFYSSTQVVSSQIDEARNSNIEVLESSRASKVSPHSQNNEQTIAYSSMAEGIESQVRSTTVTFAEAEAPLGGGQPAPAQPKRFSFKGIAFSWKATSADKSVLSTDEYDKREHAAEVAEQDKKQEKLSKSDVRAKKTALRARMLITGEPTGALPVVSPVVAKPQLNKIKSQLLETHTANKLIRELRRLPPTGHGINEGPIHAVCLEFTDAEVDNIHFAKLQSGDNRPNANDPANITFPSIVSAPLDQLATMLNRMHVIELMKVPGLGLGQPGDGAGVLAGALPTPETVIRGVREITPQLMALGFATGRPMVPDHSGIFPPTDRISVLTYWWGLEVLLPHPTIVFLSRAESITNAVVNFLSVLALVNNGVREILPFVRYIAQFIEVEFDSIKAQDKGQGVVCAATWIMPAALVPRPWDFPEAPLPTENDEDDEDADEKETVSPLLIKTPGAPTKRLSSAPSLPKPRPVSSILDLVAAKPSSPVLENGGSVRIPQMPNTPPRAAPALSVQA